MTVDLDPQHVAEALPRAIWVPSGSHRIYRGTPDEIVRDMTLQLGAELPLREALYRLVVELERAREVSIDLPWDECDESGLSALFLQALLDLGIGYPVGEA
jgi:hypothetical protein